MASKSLDSINVKHECKGCVCLKCNSVHKCHCPLKEGKLPTIPCDNYLTHEDL